MPSDVGGEFDSWDRSWTDDLPGMNSSRPRQIQNSPYEEAESALPDAAR